MLDLVGWWSLEDERVGAVGGLPVLVAALTFDLVLRAGGLLGGIPAVELIDGGVELLFWLQRLV